MTRSVRSTSRRTAGRVASLLATGALLAACGTSTPAAGPVAAAPTPAPPTAPSATPSTAPSTGPSTAPNAAPTAGPTAARAASSCTIPASLAGKDVSRLPVTDKVVALTFDGGANADGVASIRATLRRMRVKATFFLTGSFVTRYPVRSRRIAGRDLVGNHTMTHPDLTTLSDRRVRAQVRQAEAAIRSTTGQDPRRFFRFPYGASSAHLVALLNSLCYVPFRWTVDSLGWKGTSGGQTEASVVARVVRAAEPGAIVLMHVGSNPDDGTTLDAAALPHIVTRLRALGYHFVRLSRVMGPAP